MARILIIDDEEPVRNLLRQALEPEGYEVTTAANGSEGVRAHRAAPADLIITDIFMPEKEGLATITHLQLHNPQVKIFAISGFEPQQGADVLEIAKRFGAMQAFQKPLKLKNVLEAVRKAVPLNSRGRP